MSGKLVVGIDVLHSVNYDVIKVYLGSQRADGQLPDAVIALGKVGALTVVAYEHGTGQLDRLGIRGVYAKRNGMIIMHLG
jgi:hypothetical protein